MDGRSATRSAAALRVVLFLAGCAAVLLLAGCAGTPSEPNPPGPSAAQRQSDRDQLAGLAAAAKDRRYVATYTLTTPGHADRTVTVAMATDGSWVVALPAGALGGLADIAVFESADGLFQCSLGPAAGTAGVRPDLPPVTAGCVRVTGLTASTDPRVQHVFTDWIDPLVDRATALSVVTAPALAVTGGSCFSVESTSAALPAPVAPGVYCYDRAGMLTAARLDLGTLVLATTAPAPSSVTMPAPVIDRAPLPLEAPPRPPIPTGGSGSPSAGRWPSMSSVMWQALLLRRRDEAHTAGTSSRC